MALLVFTVVGLIGLIVAYTIGLGGTLGALVFLFILFIGVMLRWAEPILAHLRP